jgi:hypothetical protein
MVAPPILIILDDYDSTYKLRGVQLIQAVLSKVEPVALRRSGLGNVFLEVKLSLILYDWLMVHIIQLCTFRAYFNALHMFMERA